MKGGLVNSSSAIKLPLKNIVLIDKLNRFVPEKFKNCRDTIFCDWYRSEYGVSVETVYNEYKHCDSNYEAAYKGILNYDREQPAVDEVPWNIACSWASKHFSFMSGSVIYDSDTAIEAIDKRTSSGYPFNFLFQNKGQVFKDEETMDFMHNYWNSGCKNVTIWTANVKEEVRLSTKVDENKLRLFLGSPVHHVWASTRVFGNMNDKFYAAGANHITWSFVGATKFFGGWNRLYNRLIKHPNYVEIDESAYDCSLFRRCLLDMVDFRWQMLQPELQTYDNHVLIKRLYIELIDTFIIGPHGDIFVKATGNSSGSANTIVDNTVCLYKLLAYAYIKVAPYPYNNFKSFHSHIEAALNGDDNTWSFSDEIRFFWNGTIVAKIFDTLLVKAVVGNETLNLHECYFLSSVFFEKYGMVFPKPDTQRIMCSMYDNIKIRESAKWSLLRAMALKVESFFDVESYNILCRYISYLITSRYYRDELHQPKDDNISKKNYFSYEEIIGVDKTHLELLSLYQNF